MTINELNKTLDNIVDLADNDWNAFMDTIGKLARVTSMVQAVTSKFSSYLDKNIIDDFDADDLASMLSNLGDHKKGEA